MQDMVNKGRAKPFGGHGPHYGMTGKKMPKTHCVYCHRDIANNTYARYHGNNCKQFTPV
jgi:hypothetical protein